MELSLARRRGADTELGRQTVGNALVVHPAAGMTEEAQALALGVAADAEHDLVVVDLPVDSPISLWESVAKALPRRRRGVRLVIGGRSRETSALAGQWLAERLGRPVLAPDGSVIPSAGGALFVHSGRGSGWVKFAPGRPPKWEAKRFPRPSWDSGVTAELTSTSSRGVAEPLPGGLWIRPVGFDRQLGFHRSALIRGLPALPDTMTIVLGCPGCPPLSLDDAARLWMRLPEPVRHRARFVRYGPMATPAGTTFGQALADLLGREVGFYSGLPIGSPSALDVWTVLYDGALGWATYARELAYVPGGSARLLDHRVPLDGLKEIEPAVYWYSPDAVLEVVQSGLLLRSPSASPTAASLREVTQDPSVHNLTYDAPDGASERMLLLAEDLLARLDEHTRRLSRILPAAALLAERARVVVPRRAMAEIEAPEATPAPVKTISERLDPGAVVAGSFAPLTITVSSPVGEAAGVSLGPAAAPPAGVAGAASPLPPVTRPAGSSAAFADPTEPPPAAVVTGEAVPAGSDDSGAPVESPVDPADSDDSNAPVESSADPAGSGGSADPIGSTVSAGPGAPGPQRHNPLPPPAVPPAGVLTSPATEPPLPSPAVPPAGMAAHLPAAEPAKVPLPPPAVPPAGVATGPAVESPMAAPAAATIGPAAEPPMAPPAGPASSRATAGPAAKPAVAPLTATAAPGRATEPPAPEAETHPEAALQPIPAPEATAILPKRGVAKEREWLRKSLGAEYGLMSNAAARILSEHPGFQGALAASSADVLTDAVAVQLYLSEKGAAIDAGLRAGRNGPHVPVARCVVAGLGRLPSHRGPASVAVSLTERQWAAYRSRKVVTEWGFLHTLTTPVSTEDGDTDILVWSVTARRTKLLEPAEGVANRALFVPGTSFKILDLTEPADGKRGLVLLRELTVGEVDETGRVAADRISLDELALQSLRRELETWAETDSRESAGTRRFGAIPGLA